MAHSDAYSVRSVHAYKRHGPHHLVQVLRDRRDTVTFRTVFDHRVTPDTIERVCGLDFTIVDRIVMCATNFECNVNHTRILTMSDGYGPRTALVWLWTIL